MLTVKTVFLRQKYGKNEIVVTLDFTMFFSINGKNGKKKISSNKKIKNIVKYGKFLKIYNKKINIKECKKNYRFYRFYRTKVIKQNKPAVLWALCNVVMR